MLFIFICFILFQGAYNQNISNSVLPANISIQINSINTDISNVLKDSEVIAYNGECEQSFSLNKDHGVIVNHFFQIENTSLNNRKYIRKYYFSEKLKSSTAIRAP